MVLKKMQKRTVIDELFGNGKKEVGRNANYYIKECEK